MSNVVTAQDARYEKLFDVANEAASMGNVADFDTNAAMNALRERGPVLKGSLRELLGLGEEQRYSCPRPTFTALSFKACEIAFRENEVFTSFAYNDIPGFANMGPIMLNRIGADHREFKATGRSMFLKPAAMNWWKPNWIDGTIAVLLDRIAGMEQSDLNGDLCARLPLHVVSQGVGLRGEDALIFRDNLLRSMHANPDRAQAGATVQRMLGEMIAQRRQEPGDDVVSGLMAADFHTPEGTRKLTDAEVTGFARHLLLAGGGTTWRQLGVAIHALLDHYPFWEACRDNRALLPDAIEESVRWNVTGPSFPRLVVADVELEGVSIPAGSRVDIGLGAGNRDPRRWDDPDSFNIYRPKQPHLGFGFGPHLCFGQHVARAMMTGAISGLMDRFPHMRLDPEAPRPRLTGGLEQRGMSSIPVILR